MPAQTSPTHPGMADPAAVNSATPTPMPKAVLCPYCGHLSLNTVRCESCRGYFDPLSRQASQNSMGPWFIRDEAVPFRPGCSYETLRQLVSRGKVTRDTVIRGPGTRQFWGCARNTPGVANLLGECHACHAAAEPTDEACPSCGASFFCETDRQYFGLFPVHLLPGHSSPELIAASTLTASAGPVPVPTIAPIATPVPAAVQAQPLPLTPALDRLAAPAAGRGGGMSRGMIVAIALGIVCIVMAGVIVYMIAEGEAGMGGAVGRSGGEAPAATAPAAAEKIQNHESPQAAPPIDEKSVGDAVADPALIPNEEPGAFAPKADPVEKSLAEALVLLHANRPEALTQAEVLLRTAREGANPAQVSKIDNHLGYIEIRRAQRSLDARL